MSGPFTSRTRRWVCTSNIWDMSSDNSVFFPERKVDIIQTVGNLTNSIIKNKTAMGGFLRGVIGGVGETGEKGEKPSHQHIPEKNFCFSLIFEWDLLKSRIVNMHPNRPRPSPCFWREWRWISTQKNRQASCSHEPHRVPWRGRIWPRRSWTIDLSRDMGMIGCYGSRNFSLEFIEQS